MTAPGSTKPGRTRRRAPRPGRDDRPQRGSGATGPEPISSFPKAPPGILLLLALAAGGCSDAIQGPGGVDTVHGHFALQPVFAPPAGSISGPASAAADDALRRAFERVDAFRLIVRPLESDEVVADETISVQPGQDEYALSVEVPLSDPGELFRVELRALDGETELFRAGPFEARATPRGEQGPPTPVEAELEYVGPGAEAASVAVSPASAATVVGGTVPYTAVVFGPDEETLSDVPLGWETGDETIATVSQEGLVTAVAEGTTEVIVETPTGVRGEAVIEVLGPLQIIPAETERLPGGTQQFEVGNAPAGLTFVWFVNGVEGGDQTFGTIDSQGFYTAPAEVPDPATFDVCARANEQPDVEACAAVTIREVPTAGEDVVVVNDLNLFDTRAMENPDNHTLVRNLVSFSAEGPRADGTVVWWDSGRASACGIGVCGATSANMAATVEEITGQGLTLEEKATAEGEYASIPSEVKVIWLWQPTIPFTLEEINGFKEFAAEGGRVIFIGEHSQFYFPEDIENVENRFLMDMGAQMTNVGAQNTCVHTQLDASHLRSHQITEGMQTYTMGCASEVVPGPNDFVLFLAPSGSEGIGPPVPIGGVAKIDVTPLPTSVADPAARAVIEGGPGAPSTGTSPTVRDGTGRHVESNRPPPPR